MSANTRTDIVENANLPLPLWELVSIVGCLMALNALAIDIMLPALGEVAQTYALEKDNDRQLVLYSYILGFGIPQLFFGPLSDRYGRRGLVKICLIGYVITGFACMVASHFYALLAMRFVQGVFASGVRVIAVSIVRDLLAGRGMARVMSLVMTVFMIVPIFAPAIGQLIMIWASWQWTFGILGICGLLMLGWVHWRLPETLKADNRQDLRPIKILGAFSRVLKHRVTLGYMTASGVIFGALFAFIGASEQIFSDVFNEGHRFALWFAIIAIALGAANFINARMVERFGMRRISHSVLLAFLVLSLSNVIVMQLAGEKLIYFLPLFALTFGCFGMIGANFSAIAMEPQGKVAGTASALYGFATSTVASLFGWSVSSRFDGTVTPIMIGFCGLGVLSLMIILITERGKLFEIGRPSVQE